MRKNCTPGSVRGAPGNRRPYRGAYNIAQSFPALTLEQVYGALTFYLANKSEIDAYLKEADAEFDAMRQASREQDPMFY